MSGFDDWYEQRRRSPEQDGQPEQTRNDQGAGFEAWREKQQEARRQRLNRTLTETADTNPDRYARDRDLARRAGTKPHLVEGDREAVERAAARKETDADGLARDYRSLSDWLTSDVDNARIARDDVESLKKAHDAVATPGEPDDGPGAMVELMGDNLVGQSAQSIWNQVTYTADLERSMVSEVPGTLGRSMSGLARINDAVGRMAQRGIDAAGMESVAEMLGETDVPWWITPSGWLSRSGQQYQDIAEDIRPPEERRTFEMDVAGGLGQLSTQVAMAMVGGSVLSSAQLAGQGAEIQARRTDAADADPMAADTAVLAGAGVTMLTERYGLDRLLNRLPPAIKNRVMRKFTDVAIAGGTEAVQELTEGVLQNLTTASLYAPDAPIFEGGLLYEGGIAGTSAGIFRLALEGIVPGRQRMAAQSDQATLDRLMEASGESKLRERAPEKYEEAVARFREAGGHENVYVDVGAWNEYFQSQERDPEAAAADLLNDPAQYREAATLQGDLVIPVERLAARMDPADYESLRDHMRLRSGGVTPAEVQAAEERASEVEQELAGEAQDTDAAAQGDTSQQVFEEIRGQLLAAGVPEDVARNQAQIIQAGVRTLAEREGMDPMELFSERPLEVERPLPEILTRRETFDDLDVMLDRIRAGDIPDDRQIFGESLMEWLRGTGLRDPGGELEARDVDVGLQPFQRRLIRNDDPGAMTLDEAAEIAYDSGFFSDRARENVGPDALLDAIDQELMGNPVRRPETTNERQQDIRLALEELQNFVERSGVNLDETDNAAIRQMLEEQAEQTTPEPGANLGVSGNELYQDGINEQASNQAAVSEVQRAADRRGSQRGAGADAQREAGAVEADDDGPGVPGDTAGIEAQELELTPEEFEAAFAAGTQQDQTEEARRAWREQGTDSPFFRQWFGDSLMARRDGTPVVFHHGTNAQGLQQFDTARAGETTGLAPSGLGTWMTADRGTAQAYGDNVLSGYVRMENPYVVRADQLPDFEDVSDARAFSEELQARGHDGIYLSGTGQAVIFDSSQFKLTDNRGTFDPTDQNFYNQFAGQQAQTADTHALERARQMLDEGTDPETVRQETGWFQGADGQWRFEISDDQASQQDIGEAMGWGSREDFRRGDTGLVFLGQIIDHPRLFAAYPQLADVAVSMSKGENVSASFQDMHGLQFIRMQASTDEQGNPRLTDEQFSTLLHEIQHGIQNIEGFARGGSPELFQGQNPDDVGEQMAEAVIAAGDLVEETGLDPMDVVRSGELDETQAQLVQSIVEIGDFDEALEIARDTSIPAHEKYMRLAGEIEARNTQARQPLTEDERRDIPPESTQDRPSEQAIVMFGDADAENAPPPANADQVLEQDQPTEPGRQQARGRIRFGEDRRFRVELLEKADLSTFLHESGHYFLEVMGDLAQRDDASEQLKSDYQTVLDWLGVQSREEIGTEQHEQWARGTEAYLREGRAPSDALSRAFARFRSWLVQIYRTIRQLDVELTDEVRGVMDRVFATEEEIAAAREVMDYEGLPPEALQMTEAEREDYRREVANVREEAETELARRKYREEQRERTEWWRERREDMLDEVAAEVNAEPIYQALTFLMRGTRADGSPLPEGVQPLKLSRAVLVEEYGKDFLKRLPGGGAYNVYTRKGGVHPDYVAEMFGLGSGDALVKRLAELKAEGRHRKGDFIEAETDRRMRERYGDKDLEGAPPQAAMDAVHSDERGNLIAREIRALGRQAGRRPRPQDVVKRFAERAITEKRARDIRPDLYQRAEAKAGREALTAATEGRLQDAFDAKQRQLLNHHLYREARKAREEIERTYEYMRKFTRKRVRQRVAKAGGEYLDQIDAIMERHEFRRVPLRQMDRRAGLRSWVESQREKGYEPAVPDKVLDDAYRRNYRELPFEDLMAVRDTVKWIEHLAKLKRDIKIGQERRAFEELEREVVSSIERNARREPRRDPETHTPQAETRDFLDNFFASHRKAASLAREMDGFQDGGPLWEALIRPANEAAAMEADMSQEAMARMKELFRPLSGRIAQMQMQKEYIPEIDQSLTRAGQIMVAMNAGNADNRQRIMTSEGWSPAQVQAIINRLNKEEMDFVQGVLDYVNSFWPQVKALEERINGVAPDKVQATPIQTPHGVYPGGYFPIVYNEKRSKKAHENQVKEQAEAMLRGAQTRSMTSHGHTKERVENVKRPVRLDFNVVFDHVNKVIHDLTHRELAIESNRILRSDAISQAIIDYHGHEFHRQFEDWLTATVAGDVAAQNTAEKSLNYLRGGVSVAYMGWKLSTSMLQFTGLSQSVQRVGSKYIARGFAKWMQDAAHMENTVRWVWDQSATMRNRSKTHDREINDVRRKMRARGKLSWLEDSYFSFITIAQAMVDIPTWIGAYEKAMDAGDNHDRAVALADQAVLDTQGGGQIKDLADIQRGHPLKKLWTSFYSYFNTSYNLMAESRRQVHARDPASMARFAKDFALVFMFPALVPPLLMGYGPDDDDEWGEWVVRNTALYMAGSMVFVRDLGSALFGFFGYEGPAGASFFSEAGRFAQQAGQGEVDEALVKSANRTAGILFHYPAAQLDTAYDGFQSWNDGHANGPLDVFQILTTGETEEQRSLDSRR